MSTRKIMNVKTVRSLNYHTLDMGEFTKYMGQPEARFIAMLYGESGSGKSVFALRLANFLADNHGKTLYNSHEERVNKTIQDRVLEWKISSSKLYFGNALSFEEMTEAIRKNYYRFVVIDSVQYMAFTYDQLRELRAMFKRRSLGVILVSFGASEGNPDKARELLHASDVKLYFKQGTLKSVSRYLGAPGKHRLFGAHSAQGGLF